MALEGYRNLPGHLKELAEKGDVSPEVAEKLKLYSGWSQALINDTDSANQRAQEFGKQIDDDNKTIQMIEHLIHLRNT